MLIWKHGENAIKKDGLFDVVTQPQSRLELFLSECDFKIKLTPLLVIFKQIEEDCEKRFVRFL